jgi:hypothetical protein
MLTHNEVKAHLAIIDMVTRKATGYHGLATQPHLMVFRPRCPACRAALELSPVLDGLQLVWCRSCGHKWRECT